MLDLQIEALSVVSTSPSVLAGSGTVGGGAARTGRKAEMALARNNLVHDLWISAYTGVGGVTERGYSMLGWVVGADGSNARLPNLWGDRLVVQEI